MRGWFRESGLIVRTHSSGRVWVIGSQPCPLRGLLRAGDFTVGEGIYGTGTNRMGCYHWEELIPSGSYAL